MGKGKRTSNLESMHELILKINPRQRMQCLRLYEDNQELFKSAFGSVHNHQSWRGGYHDHIVEVMNIAVKLYTAFECRKLPALGDILLVLFLHDLEKPWKYERGPDRKLRHTNLFTTKEQAHAFRLKKCAEYGIRLTKLQENGIRYAEGELADYSNRKRVASRLAAFAHACDHLSARVWHDYPKPEHRIA